MNIMTSINTLNSLNTSESQIVRNPFAARESAEKTKAGGFESYLIGALEYVNDKQIANAAITQQFKVDPDSLDIHDVTTAMAMASMSLEAANRIINQMVSSWNEIITTR